jgi:hypothetical protein
MSAFLFCGKLNTLKKKDIILKDSNTLLIAFGNIS